MPVGATAWTQSVPVNAEVGNLGSGLGGTPPNLIDVAPGYDFNPALPTGNPGCSEGDGQGEIHGKNGGNAQFQSDEDTCEDHDQDSEQFKDAGAGVDFHATTIQSVQFNDGLGTMAVAGKGLDNGQPVTFLIVEQAATSLTPAVYSMQLGDGYVNSGSLLSGNITLQ
jgi:hypothetical protein